MFKNRRLWLFGGLSVALVALGAIYLFEGDNEGQAVDPNANTSAQNDPGTYENQSGPALISVENDANTDGQPLSILPENLLPTSEDEVVSAETEPTSAETVETKKEPEPSTAGQVVWYTIKSGDIVGRIANRFGCRSSDIYELNAPKITKENAHKIRVGWKIKVLNSAGLSGFDAVDGSTVSKGSSDTTSTEEVKLPEPPAEIRKPIGYKTAHVHDLQPGDTYFTLSIKYYGARNYWNVIDEANREVWDGVTYEKGVKIVIPSLESVKAGEPKIREPIKSAKDSIIPAMKTNDGKEVKKGS